MSFDSLLNKTMSVQRSTLTADGQGGGTKTWATVHTGIKCRINAMGAKEIAVLWDARNVAADYLVFCRTTKAILEADRIIISSRTFEVKKVDNYDEMGHHYRISCLEVRP